jgi:hypothetical protein
MEFISGGKYGIEIASVNSLAVLRDLLKFCNEYSFIPDRVDECRGFSRLPKNEVAEIVQICRDEGIGFFTGISLRSMYDIGGYAKSKNGYRASYKIRGNTGILKAYDEIRRAIDFGIRGFIIYDEGLLYFLNQQRAQNKIPADVVFKISVHLGVSNPFSSILMCELGANTLNPVPDLSIEMLKELRESIQVPLDIFTDTSTDGGGFLRTSEIIDIIKNCSPVYLKCGSISQVHQNHLPNQTEILERVRQTRCVLDVIENDSEVYLRVNKKEVTLGIPTR